MASRTTISNQALSHLGEGKEIQDLDSERSEEAQACRRFYDTALQATLRDFPWPFATRIVALGLVQMNPTTEWLCSYRYPSNCLYIRRFISGMRVDTDDTRTPYKLIGDDVGQLILTNLPTASIEYVALVDAPDRYPQDFVLALSLRLAMYIAPRLTGGDAARLTDRCMRLYQYELTTARANALNEEHTDKDPDSEYIRARG